MSKERLCNIELAREAGLSIHRFPSTSEEVAIAEDALARELSNLSLDEQEKIIFDIHGIQTTAPEDDAAIVSSLEQLEKEIQKINKKEAYEQAIFLNESYAKDVQFRLHFLRALGFNVEAAADMMVQHFDVKRQLFGDGEVLAREIRQSDLSPTELEILKAGFSQVLPTRDASGRTVIAVNAEIPDLGALEELIRCSFYTSMAMLRDEEINKTGVVWVFYNMRNIWMDLPVFQAVNRVDAAIPLVVLGGHYSFNSHMLRPLVTGVQLFFNRYERHRLRTHFGSLEEIHFKLQTFGIPTDVSPMQADETWTTEYHLEWLQAQRIGEEERARNEQSANKHNTGTSSGVGGGGGVSSNVVIIPRRFDVLFGKSSRARLSTGTQRALLLVDMHREPYEKASKFEKTKVAETIVSIIHESKGRFLKQDEEKGGWVEVDDLVARQKVSHWFRHMRWKTTNKPQDGDNDENQAEPTSSNKNREEVTDSLTEEELARPTKRVASSPSPTIVSADDDDESDDSDKNNNNNNNKSSSSAVTMNAVVSSRISASSGVSEVVALVTRGEQEKHLRARV